MLTPRIFHRDMRMTCALSRQMCQDDNCDQLHTGIDQEPAPETSNASGARAAQSLPLVILQSSFSILASVPAAWNLQERGSGLERGLHALQGSALGAAAWRAPGGRRRRNEGVVAKSKPRGRMWRARWCPL